MAKILGNADLTKIYTTKAFNTGALVEDENGNVFRFIKYNAGDGAAACVAGYVIVGLDIHVTQLGTDILDASFAVQVTLCTYIDFTIRLQPEFFTGVKCHPVTVEG